MKTKMRGGGKKSYENGKGFVKLNSKLDILTASLKKNITRGKNYGKKNLKNATLREKKLVRLLTSFTEMGKKDR